MELNYIKNIIRMSSQVSTMDLFDTMSITKAVIGLLFYRYHRGDPREKMYKNVELEDALNMRSGIVSPPFENTYEKHQNAHDVTALCRGVLDNSTGDGTDPFFIYNDFVYQLLPNVFNWEGGQLDAAFTDFMGGTTDGWKWKKDARGCVFAPNGLSMTKDVAMKFAVRAREHVLQQCACTSAFYVPPHRLLDPLQDTGVTHYWHGWWVALGAVFAYGWKIQLIAIDRYLPEHIEVVLEGEVQWNHGYKNTTTRTIRNFLGSRPRYWYSI